MSTLPTTNRFDADRYKKTVDDFWTVLGRGVINSEPVREQEGRLICLADSRVRRGNFGAGVRGKRGKGLGREL